VAVSYNLGTGIAEVTDPAIGLPLQGMADESQIATGVESPLYARVWVLSSSGLGAAIKSRAASGRFAIAERRSSGHWWRRSAGARRETLVPATHRASVAEH
jgi:hypothetical protein